MLTLKDYQQRTLEALKAYFISCSQTGNANTAFYSTTLALLDVGIPYNPLVRCQGFPTCAFAFRLEAGRHSLHAIP